MIIQRLCSLSCQLTTYGSITISYEYHRGELNIHLEDTGMGFTSDELSHVFEHFSRNPTGEITGSGLDLPILQVLTKQMGGTIEIQSESRKGTSVWVSIPCTAYVIEKKRL